jgi:ribosomal protein S18 acetylase RimI-like enzyme
VEILDLRHFSSVDLRPLLEQEVKVWAETLSWDYSGSLDMILRYIDAKILPGYAALDRGAILGYSFFVYEGSKGVIGDLFVAGGRSLTRDAELRLLTHVIETLQQSPGIHRAEAQLLAYETGYISQPFLDTGFDRQPRLFMVQNLASVRATRRASLAGIEIRPWSEQDYQPVAALITACYRGHVDAMINDQYRSLAGSLRFLNNIVRFPGCGVFDPGSSFVAINTMLHTTIGVSLCSHIRADVGHVTQVCVLPEYQKHGIGEALLAHSAAALQERNFTALSLTVTQANAGAVHLYERLGFRTARIFDAFVWEG